MKNLRMTRRGGVLDYRLRLKSKRGLQLQEYEGDESPHASSTGSLSPRLFSRRDIVSGPGIREPSGRVKSYRVEMRLRASNWSTSRKTWVGSFNALKKAMRAYDAALHYTGKTPYYFVYPKCFFDDRLPPGLEGAPQTNEFVCFIKRMAKNYAMDTQKLQPRLQRNPSSKEDRSRSRRVVLKDKHHRPRDSEAAFNFETDPHLLSAAGRCAEIPATTSSASTNKTFLSKQIFTTNSPVTDHSWDTRNDLYLSRENSSCAHSEDTRKFDWQGGDLELAEANLITSSLQQVSRELNPELENLLNASKQTTRSDNYSESLKMNFDMSLSTDEYAESLSTTASLMTTSQTSSSNNHLGNYNCWPVDQEELQNLLRFSPVIDDDAHMTNPLHTSIGAKKALDLKLLGLGSSPPQLQGFSELFVSNLRLNSSCDDTSQGRS